MGSDIYSSISEVAATKPQAVALIGPGRNPLTFHETLAQIESTVAGLNRMGIGRGDRVAIVAPNGPELALATLAIACGAVSAPLNPAYSEAEFEFFLDDLKPKALALGGDANSLAAAVARRRQIPVLRFEADQRTAGRFVLEGNPVGETPLENGLAEAGEVALVLHTSGSTARPKIVPLTHANLSASADNIRLSLGLTPEDRCLNVMPLFHIHGLVGAVLSSLSAGASVVCTPGFQAPPFLDWLDEFRPTWYTAVPTMHQAIVERAAGRQDGTGRTGLRFIRSCSSALAPVLARQVESVFGVPLVEAYGMTEASHQMAINPLPPGKRKPGSVGVAAGCEIAIMNQNGDLLTPGETGEVVIRGPNVMRGYQDNPEANARSFTAGWFRTGDQGRVDEEGYLFLTGRLKEIINRGGEKISPREIDEVLLQHPAVAAAMAFAIPDGRLGEEVAASVVLRPGAEADESELMEFASRGLADFKVPRRIVFLTELPKGPTGKPQRIGLAERLGLNGTAVAAPAIETDGAKPVSDTATKLAAIWKQVLRLERIGLDDDFFARGGDSILGAQIIVRVREECAVDLPMFRLFASPTIRLLAAWIDSTQPTKRKPSDPIPAAPRDGPLALSFSQQRMWFLAHFEESSAAYVIPMAFRLCGPVDRDALRASFQRMVERHEALRTTFAVHDGAPFQCIHRDCQFDLPLVDQPGIPQEQRDDAAHRLAIEEAHRHMDIQRETPLRVVLVRFAGEDHLLLITLHHIASDGWSKSILLRELEVCYRAFHSGSEPALAPLPIQYADYAAWYSHVVDGERGQGLIAYWKKRLAGAPELLELPTDRPRPAQQSYVGGTARLMLSDDLASSLLALSRRESASLYMTTLAAFQVLLGRYSGQSDIVVGTPTANRTRPETERLIGTLVNTLVMRTDLSEDPTFRELLARVRITVLEAQDHQDLPVERLIEELQPQRTLSYPPVFQVMFQLLNFPEIVARFEGIEVSRVVFDSGAAQFDLLLELENSAEGLECELHYNDALFDRTTAERMLEHYRTLLEGIAANPATRISQLPLLTQAEKRQMLLEWNRTEAEYPRESPLGLFEQQAIRTPEAVAVSDERQSWSYGELNRRADRVASFLRENGTSSNEPIAICLSRSVELVAALLGVWKAGAAYVPLDSAYPADRMSFILGDSGASLVLTERRFENRFQGGTVIRLLEDAWRAHDQPAPGLELAGSDPAYILYTSGSTGRPKGVAISHRALTNLLSAMSREIQAGPSDVFLAITTVVFDIAVVELLLPLTAGARVFVAGTEVAGDGSRMAQAIEFCGATFVQATPATWQILCDSGWNPSRKLKIVSGGEPLSRALAKRLLRHGQVWNGYGPTEATVYSVIAKLAADDSTVPIGRPLANTKLYVLDGERQPVPVGVPGELYIGGAGVAIGYWRHPELTLERFLPDPFSPEGAERLFRTGDLVRYLPDGNLVFLRRIDSQVKIRGFRIELEEVEAVLGEHPGVRAAAAMVIDMGPEDRRLAAFYAGRGGVQPRAAELREFLLTKLPAYMVPSVLTPLSALPLTPTGKIDRKRLPSVTASAAEAVGRTAQNMVQQLLVEIWEDVLGRRPIGLDDDFFALGGHSLLGARMLARIESTFGVRLPMSSFFEAPTVARLEARLGPGAKAAASRVIPIQSGESVLPLYILHPSPVIRPVTLALPPKQRVFSVAVIADEELSSQPSLEWMATRQIRAIREFQPHGPYVLAGWCADGVLAYEMAQQLRREGECVPLVVLIDSYLNWLRNATPGKLAWVWLGARVQWIRFHMKDLTRGGIATGVYRKYVRFRNRAKGEEAINRQETNQLASIQAYEARPYEGSVILFRAKDRPEGRFADAAYGWRGLARDLEVVDVPGTHVNMLQNAGASLIAARLSSRIAAAS
jgi:amino acid adenylation domain-containing protein